jgi:hypothetical protein
MTLAKAKDYFSAYYEGSLDRGLKQALETRMREDAQLQSEYRAFERTMQALESFGTVEIEPPADLHDKISARLDKVVWEQKRQKASGFSFAWWKGLVAVSAAAACIFGFLSYSKNQANVSPASVFGGSGNSSAAQFTFGAATANGRSLEMSYPAGDAKVSIKDAEGHFLGEPMDLQGREIKSKPLENSSDAAQLITVEADLNDNSSVASYVALAGKTKDPATTGKGTVKDMALAIAAHYQIPVVVQNKVDGDAPTSWDLSVPDPLGAAHAALTGLSVSVQQDKSGILLIVHE